MKKTNTTPVSVTETTTTNEKAARTLTPEFIQAYYEYLKHGTIFQADQFAGWGAAGDIILGLDEVCAMRNAHPDLKEWAEGVFAEYGDEARDAVCLTTVFADAKGNEKSREDIMKSLLKGVSYAKPLMKLNESGQWEPSEQKKTLSFVSIEKWYCKTMDKVRNASLAQNHQWELHVYALIDNLQINASAECGNKLTMKKSPYAADFKERNGYDKASKAALKEQLNKVMKQIMPESIVPMFRNSDISYLLKAFEKASKGELRMLSMSQITNELFVITKKAIDNAQYKRYSNDKVYKA